MLRVSICPPISRARKYHLEKVSDNYAALEHTHYSLCFENIDCDRRNSPTFTVAAFANLFY